MIPRRWLQFRLRTFLLVVLVLCLPLSWFAVKIQRARRQREAVEVVKELGGGVIYDWNSHGNSPARTWSRDLLGDEFFDEVTHVLLQHTEATDDILRHVKWFDHLFELCLLDTQITDDGLRQLEGMSDLKHLDLRSTRVTPAGGKRLQVALPNCKIEY